MASTSIFYENTFFSTQGSPTPTIQAYIGLDGTISVSGDVVSNFVEGPIDVFGKAYMFRHLTPDMDYRFIVVAENAIGYSVKQIVKHTATCTAVAFPDEYLQAMIRDYLYQPTGPICQDELLQITEVSDQSRPYGYINDLTGLGQCTGLQTLILGEHLNPYGDPISLTPIAQLTNLNYLSLSGQTITSLAPLTSLTNLSNLYINNTLLGDFSAISDISNLYSLDVSNNSIVDITDFVDIITGAAGTQVNLSGNPLSEDSISQLCDYLSQGKNVSFDGQENCP